MANKPVKMKRFNRFDEARAESGVNVNVRDGHGEYVGTFKVSYRSDTNKPFQVATERYKRLHSDDAGAKGKYPGVHAFVHCCLHGWEGVVDEDGKPIEFSPDNAFDILSAEENIWIFSTLHDAASDVSNFARIPDAGKIAGN